MLYFTCIMISRIELARYRIYHAKDLDICDCGTTPFTSISKYLFWEHKIYLEISVV